MIQSPAIARIRSYLDHLDNPQTSTEHRLAHWKLIISAAYDAHELEVQQLDEMKITAVDPAFSDMEPLV